MNAAISKSSRLLRRPWFAVWRLLEKKAYWGRSYSLQIPYGQRIFTPWFDQSPSSDFARALAAVRTFGPLVVSPDRCYMLYQCSGLSSDCSSTLSANFTPDLCQAHLKK